MMEPDIAVADINPDKKRKKKKKRHQLLLGCVDVPSSADDTFVSTVKTKKKKKCKKSEENPERKKIHCGPGEASIVLSASIKKDKKKKKKLEKIEERNRKKKAKKKEKLNKKIFSEEGQKIKEERKIKDQKIKEDQGRSRKVERSEKKEKSAPSKNNSVLVWEIEESQHTEMNGKVNTPPENPKKRKTEHENETSHSPSAKRRKKKSTETAGDSHVTSTDKESQPSSNVGLVGDGGGTREEKPLTALPRKKKKEKQSKSDPEAEVKSISLVNSDTLKSPQPTASPTSLDIVAEETFASSNSFPIPKKRKKKKKSNEDAKDASLVDNIDSSGAISISVTKPSQELKIEPQDALMTELKETIKKRRKKKKSVKNSKDGSTVDSMDCSDISISDSKHQVEPRHALLVELKETIKKKKKSVEAMTAPRSSPTPNLSTSTPDPKTALGQWGNVQLGSAEKTQKFFKLLGGLKNPAASPLSFGSSIGSISSVGSEPKSDKSFMALGKKDSDTLSSKLEAQFKKAVGGIGRGKVGLGYEASPHLDPSKKKFHIDTTVSKSVKF